MPQWTGKMGTSTTKAGQVDAFDVGPSRDGDQFHYSRASRLCLELLEATSDLNVVSVEGISNADGVDAGAESIDLALYYGSTDLSKARRVHYRQLKHSTLHPDKEWTASGLRKTLTDFAARFTELVTRFGVDDVCARFVFEFETNRPLSAKVERAFVELQQGLAGREARYVGSVTGLSPAEIKIFAGLFKPITRVEGFLEQRALLDMDLRAYLPDSDKDAARTLRDLVARKATSEFKKNHEIHREDVLDAMGVRLDDLFPASNLLEKPAVVVPRAQMPDLIETIKTARSPIILSADGGYGKSIVATQIGLAMPESMTFVYDCFGNGGYRNGIDLRHRAKDGLVQLANEMATRALCHPLIPTPKADDASYVRAFLARVTQASAAIGDDTLLILVLDAADNAEMASQEFHDPPSFPRLLLAQTFPSNVRLVLTARPHRVDRLRPAPEIVRFRLDGFTEKETGDLLKSRFPDAREVDIQEFHRLTSHNPRVQRAALDLDPAAALPAVLRSLGPRPRTVEDTIGELLAKAISRVRHSAPDVEQPQIDCICAALATLRPFVPITIIAQTAGVDEGLVRSFVHDLGRPLLLRDDAVQFRDEPTETWFQEQFKPGAEQLDAFVRRLKPLARDSQYAASALPALMLSTGRLDELVHLALSEDALPHNDEIARRDIELQRLEFATRAALREGRYVEAAKLALKAGGRVAADDRKQTLLSGNVDLAARFLGSDQLLEQVARRQISGGNWTGSEHAYEAALLSGREDLRGEARARLRFAYDWLGHYFRNRHENDHNQSLEDKDVLELHWTELNVHGPECCASQLRRWSPRRLSFAVGHPLAGRLVDAGRWTDTDALALAAGNDVGLVLAVADQLHRVSRHVPKAAAARTLRLLLHPRIKLEAPGDWRGEGTRILAIAAMVATARHYRLSSKRALAGLLRRYLPKKTPHALESEHSHDDRFAFLRAYALLADLERKAFTLEFIYGPAPKSKAKGTNERRFSSREFTNLKALLPWHELNTRVRSGVLTAQDFESALAAALEAWSRHRADVYRDWSATADEIARLWSECIVLLGGGDALWERLAVWQADLRIPLYIPTLADLARRAAMTGGSLDVVLRFAQKAHGRIGEDTEPAESLADSYIVLARAVLGGAEDEARQYFNEAVRVSSKIGQENLERWHALLHMADACAADRADDAQLAYRFSRAAELTYSYVHRDKHFDWEHTVEALALLSARTAPAILSRWRDRRFGDPERFVPHLVETLCKRGDLDARDAASFVCFDGYWDWPMLVAAALDAAAGAAAKQKLLAHFYRYMRFSPSSRQIKDVVKTVESRGLDAQRFRHLEERARRAEAKHESREESWTASREDDLDWDFVFAGVDVGTPAGLVDSVARLPDEHFGRWRAQWMHEALARVPAGRERLFVESLHAVDDWTPYAVRGLFESIPDSWAGRLAARHGLADFVRRMAQEHATGLGVNRHYESLPYELVLEKTGVTRDELLRVALDSIANTSLPTTSHALFQLVAVLAQFLDASSARSVLDYGLGHLEQALGSEQGDGRWSGRLDHGGGCREALAGYIWAALGAVESDRRWQAAHVVRALCGLEREALLGDVVALATAGTMTAFTDAKLHFYRMHAVQWLLLALARTARESGALVARHAPWLASHATRQNPHVFYRGMAAQTLLALADHGHIDLEPTTRAGLEQINSSTLPVEFSAYHARSQGSLPETEEACDFSFGYDFSRHWFEPLARCFSIRPKDVESIACRIIRVDWGLDETGYYDRDARATRGYFSESNRRRGRELGGQDDLSSYLSYHAVMAAAGELLESLPLHEDPESSWGSFAYWLEHYASLHDDGDWLADHRDLPPRDAIQFPQSQKETWPVAATKTYGLSRLQVDEANVVVAGSWTQYQGRSCETLRVISALASPSRAGALSRALATARNPYDFALPEFDDTHEIDHGQFVLKGWVRESGRESGIDSDDPWAGGLARRFLDIVDPIAAELGLVADGSRTAWLQADGTCVAWVERWGQSSDDERGHAPSGQRLVVDRQFLRRSLRLLNQTLVVEVRCHRYVVPFNYESRSEDGAEEHSTSIVTVEGTGAPRLVGTIAGPRTKARRRAKARRVN